MIENVYKQTRKCGKGDCCNPTVVKLPCGCELTRERIIIITKEDLEKKKNECPKCGRETILVDRFAPWRCDPRNPVYGPGPSDYGRIPSHRYECKCGWRGEWQ